MSLPLPSSCLVYNPYVNQCVLVSSPGRKKNNKHPSSVLPVATVAPFWPQAFSPHVHHAHGASKEASDHHCVAKASPYGTAGGYCCDLDLAYVGGARIDYGQHFPSQDDNSNWVLQSTSNLFVLPPPEFIEDLFSSPDHEFNATVIHCERMEKELCLVEELMMLTNFRDIQYGSRRSWRQQQQRKIISGAFQILCNMVNTALAGSKRQVLVQEFYMLVGGTKTT